MEITKKTNTMHYLITEPGAHRMSLLQLLSSTRGTLRIASAYVTDASLLRSAGANDREIRLLTGLSRSDIDCGASSLDSLRMLVNSGVQCRCIFEKPKFHAKVYIAGNDSALVTSANLTNNALDHNIEVGSLVQGEVVGELIHWFDSLWELAKPLDVALIDDLIKQTALSRSEYLLLTNNKPLVFPKAMQCEKVQPTSVAHSPLSRRFFLCNTNRKFSAEAEALMKNKGYVAAWEDFSYTSHMQRVGRGDVIFMYKNGVGVIAIGMAKDTCTHVKPGRNNLVFSGATTTEWQIPVAWLTWVDSDRAATWTPVIYKTFQEISGNEYAKQRLLVLQKLLGTDEIP